MKISSVRHDCFLKCPGSLIRLILLGDNFGVHFSDYDDYPVFNAATQRYVDRVNAYTKSIGQFQKSLYMNYAYPTQSVIQSYGEENVRFLKGVSKKYDPQQIFQKLVPGGFKLNG